MFSLGSSGVRRKRGEGLFLWVDYRASVMPLEMPISPPPPIPPPSLASPPLTPSLSLLLPSEGEKGLCCYGGRRREEANRKRGGGISLIYVPLLPPFPCYSSSLVVPASFSSGLEGEKRDFLSPPLSQASLSPFPKG